MQIYIPRLYNAIIDGYPRFGLCYKNCTYCNNLIWANSSPYGSYEFCKCQVCGQVNIIEMSHAKCFEPYINYDDYDLALSAISNYSDAGPYTDKLELRISLYKKMRMISTCENTHDVLCYPRRYYPHMKNIEYLLASLDCGTIQLDFLCELLRFIGKFDECIEQIKSYEELKEDLRRLEVSGNDAVSQRKRLRLLLMMNKTIQIKSSSYSLTDIIEKNRIACEYGLTLPFDPSDNVRDIAIRTYELDDIGNITPLIKTENLEMEELYERQNFLKSLHKIRNNI